MSRSLESQPPGPALGTVMDGIASLVARHRRAEEVEKQRGMERFEAAVFLTTPHDSYEGEISRTYDPMPYAEAAPTPEQDYVGTGIGFLYGLGGEQHAWQLAGWNIGRAS